MSVKCTTCNKSCSFRKEPFSSDYTALETRYTALVEAVKKIKNYARHYPDCNESESPFCQCGLEAARAEVDRILSEEK